MKERKEKHDKNAMSMQSLGLLWLWWVDSLLFHDLKFHTWFKIYMHKKQWYATFLINSVGFPFLF
jgi:hypothetical protein